MFNRQSRVLLVLLFLLGIVLIAGFALIAAMPSEPSISYDEETLTVNFERTAIAMFTANPTLALSSTPSFPRIIYHELLRQLTATLPPAQSSIVAPTISAEHPCAPALTSVTGLDVTDRLQQDLEAHGLDEVFVFIVSTTVGGFDVNCTIPTVTVRTFFQFAIGVTDLSDESELASITSLILNEMIESSSDASITLEAGDVQIFFEDTDGNTRQVFSDVGIAVDAVRSGLAGLELIRVMGGFQP